MTQKVEKVTIRLKSKELKKAAIDYDLKTNAEIADIIGVSVPQLWKIMLPFEDERHIAPTQTFIAGVLSAFNAPFEQFFYLDKSGTNVTDEEII